MACSRAALGALIWLIENGYDYGQDHSLLANLEACRMKSGLALRNE
jgi:hypothetical protein